MDEHELIIKALKIEASIKPNDKIIIGNIVLTYKELSEMLDNIDKIDPVVKRFIVNFLKTSLRMFRECEEFRKMVISLVGE